MIRESKAYLVEFRVWLAPPRDVVVVVVAERRQRLGRQSLFHQNFLSNHWVISFRAPTSSSTKLFFQLTPFLHTCFVHKSFYARNRPPLFTLCFILFFHWGAYSIERLLGIKFINSVTINLIRHAFWWTLHAEGTVSQTLERGTGLIPGRMTCGQKSLSTNRSPTIFHGFGFTFSSSSEWQSLAPLLAAAAATVAICIWWCRVCRGW